MTSATERLRALLTERGVEWEADDTQVDSTGTMYCVTYVKEGYGRTWVYEEPPDCDLLISYNYDLGAEQAIAATLGPGTCHPIISDNLNESEGAGDAWADCSECGHLLFVLTDPNSQPPNYCPNCGRKLVK